MPTLASILNDIKALQKELKINLPAVDQEFDVPESVIYPIDTSSDKFWRAIRVQLYGFMYKIGDEGDADEPEFISVTQRDNDVRVLHTPSGKAEPSTIQALQKQYPRRSVLAFNALDDENVHEVSVSCAAFDSDTDSGWERFVAATGEDLRNVGSSFVERVNPGLISPGRLLDFIGDKLTSGLTDSPETIGSEEIVTDARHLWKRPTTKTRWSAYKWVVFRRDNQEAWYLTLWRLDLDANPVDFTLATARALGDRSVGISDVEVAIRPNQKAAAALRVLNGESPDTVAAVFNLDPNELKRSIREFLSIDTQTMNDSIRKGMLGEILLCRREIEQLKAELEKLG